MMILCKFCDSVQFIFAVIQVPLILDLGRLLILSCTESPLQTRAQLVEVQEEFYVGN